MNPINVMTYTGKLVDVLNIKPDDICIEDIAHSLALQCRYTGHVKEFYSVAQHCVLMSELDLPSDPMARLLHDSAETYIADITTWIKRKTRLNGKPIAFVERDILNIVGEVFDVNFEDAWEDIILGDKLMLAAEANALMPLGFQKFLKPCPMSFKIMISPWSWQQAEQIFTQAVHELQKGKR